MTNHSEHAPGHHKKTMIIVNGREREFIGHKITYEEAVALAFPGEQTGRDTTVYTVAYASHHGKDGTLVAGQSVEVHEGMVFNVTKTNRS
ncbi:MAG: multiubiquitin domain-containing protein [Oryzomonas sp.]|uniref:multiubiquitin domain-containing protein n=1 Tax=Oryzomonas sp. TaxID=2855186 RepID=UPI00284E123A|nr:multiubiquitin domain-containing protein [Oryzomonas sp.]MDR3579205.1 multiubiquitin domain-containing protein [Oryzomonas sp.]